MKRCFRHPLGILALSVLLAGGVSAQNTPCPQVVEPPMGCSLSCGQSIEGLLTSRDAVDDYSFTGGVQDVVSVNVARFPILKGPTSFRVLDPNGAVLGSATRAGLENVVLEQEGRHVIEVFVGEADDPGPYMIGLEWLLPAEQQCLESVMTCGSVETGEVGPADMGIYAFEGNAGDRVGIHVAPRSGRKGPSSYQVVRPDGTILVEVRDPGPQDVDLKQDGTHLFQVFAGVPDGQGGPGEYSAALEWVLPATKQCPEQVLTCGSVETGQLQSSADMGIYAFDGDAGDRVRFEVKPPVGLNGPSTYAIVGPNGQVLQEVPGGGVQDVTLAQAGRHLIRVVVGEDEGPGPYVVKLKWLAPDEKRCMAFIRGDCDGDGTVPGAVADAVFFLNFQFIGSRQPACLAACDADGDGELTVTDAIFLLNFLFLGQRNPPPPFPDCQISNRPEDQRVGCAEETCIIP